MRRRVVGNTRRGHKTAAHGSKLEVKGMATRGIAATFHSLVLLALLCGPANTLAQNNNRLQPYVAASKLYALYKPADWKVQEEARPDLFRILVNSPDGTSAVDFFWSPNPQRKPDALWFLNAYRNYLSQAHHDVALSEVFVSQDASHALATVRFSVGKTPVQGRYYFESTAAGLSAQGYSAPASRLASERPLLLNVMASLAFVKAPRSSSAGAQPNAPQTRPVEVALVPRQAQDGSLSIRLPSDWVFVGAGGKVVTGAPDGGTGFVFTSLSGNPLVRGVPISQGVIATPYQPPAQALILILQAFGNSSVRVHSTQPDYATMQQFPAYTRGARCDAQDIIVTWTSNKGISCLGAIKMINALPSLTGLWSVIMAGVWGPENDFQRYLPMLEQVASSFSINDQYARNYIRSGLENLRRLQQKTAAAMQDLNRAREDNQAAWEARQARKDYMDSKWDDYRRGNSYWISDLEGGKVYHTDNWGTRDTVTGDYYEGKGYNWVNFEGQNPRHPSENMREVSSYELQQLQGRQR
jgi:hypothetical protein